MSNATGLRFNKSTQSTPYGKFRFLIEIDGFALAGFHKCSELEAKTEVRKYRDGGDNTSFRKAPGLTDYSDITLERGMSDDKDFMAWAKQTHALNGKVNFAKRNLSIILLDQDGNEAKRWDVYEAWVNAYKIDSLDAESNDNMLEFITISHEGFEQVL